jgi:hypothetical protein
MCIGYTTCETTKYWYRKQKNDERKIFLLKYLDDQQTPLRRVQSAALLTPPNRHPIK